MTNLEQFIAGYIKCLYFVDTGDDDQPSSDRVLSDEAYEYVVDICTTFWDNYGDIVMAATCTGYDVTQAERAGFDFYLTRQGHGSGFWDGDWSEPHGDTLTEASGYSGDHVYLDDDGYISIM